MIDKRTFLFFVVLGFTFAIMFFLAYKVGSLDTCQKSGGVLLKNGSCAIESSDQWAFGGLTAGNVGGFTADRLLNICTKNGYFYVSGISN